LAQAWSLIESAEGHHGEKAQEGEIEEIEAVKDGQTCRFGSQEKGNEEDGEKVNSKKEDGKKEGGHQPGASSRFRINK
jgi:hypothetical protein